MTIAARSIDAELTADTFPSDPYPTYRRLRDEDHVHWSEPWSQWLLSRYEDVVRVLREPETFGSAGWESRFLERFAPEDRERLPTLQAHFRPAAFLSITDPPDHARMRRPVVRTLTPRVIASVEPFIERVIDGLFDDIERTGRFDAVRDFGYPLPGSVITEMMGLPLEDRDRFLAWSEDVVDFVSTGAPSIDRALQAEASMAGLRSYLDAFIDARRTDPDDGIISLLVETGGLGDPFSQDELIATATAVVTAGHETTANLIGNGVLALLRDPSQLERLREEPALATTAVEEFLRFDAPLQRFRRVVRHDIELGGRENPPGPARDGVRRVRESRSSRVPGSRIAGRRPDREPASGVRPRHPLLCRGRALAARGPDRLRAVAGPVPEAAARPRGVAGLASQHRVPRPGCAAGPSRLTRYPPQRTRAQSRPLTHDRAHAYTGPLDIYHTEGTMLHDDDAVSSDAGDGRAATALRSRNGKRVAFGAEERRLREEIGFYSNLLVELGLLEFKGGNLSVRIDEHDMLITRRGVAKAIPGIDEIVRTSIVEEDEGSFQASSAMEIHRAIYQATDATAVIHAHPSKTVSLSLFLDELVPQDENGLLYLRPKVSVVAPPSLFGWNLAATEMADCLRTEQVVVQKWHGTFAKGTDLADAFHRTRAVEFMSAHLIRIEELRQYFGEPTPPPTEMASVIGGKPGRGLKRMA